MQKISCVNQQLIDIHATSQNTQLQYTRNSSPKPIPNRYLRNWLRESKCYAPLLAASQLDSFCKK